MMQTPLGLLFWYFVRIPSLNGGAADKVKTLYTNQSGYSNYSTSIVDSWS